MDDLHDVPHPTRMRPRDWGRKEARQCGDRPSPLWAPDRTSNAGLNPPIAWQAVQTNTLPAGPFNQPIPQATGDSAFFRLRMN